MSHLQYYAYPGVGERNRKQFRYSQAVRIGDRIECAGQGEDALALTEPNFTLFLHLPKTADHPG
jgi:hypothetical protein